MPTRTPAPIPNRADENDVTRNSQGVEPGVEVTLMVDEPIRAIGSSPRVAHADVVRSEAPPERQHAGNDVSPQIRGRGIAMQEDDGIPFADVHVRHGGVAHPDALSKRRRLC